MLASLVEIRSLEDTKLLANSLAKWLCDHYIEGASIGFSGGLGAGKTTFISYLVRAFGSVDHVSSPTYGLMNEYTAPGLFLEHWDLYRLSEAPEELLEQRQGVYYLIEWPERCSELVENLTLHISISLKQDDYRLFQFSGNSFAHK